MIPALLQVALGGALGAVLRYGVGLAVGFPWGTLAVNVAGCFLIGLVWIWLAGRPGAAWLPFLMTGVLGGFTTFSTFSLDALRLVQEGRGALAAGYVAGSVALGLAAVAAAVALAQRMTQ